MAYQVFNIVPDVMKLIPKSEFKPLTKEVIINAICLLLKIKISDIKSKNRKREVVDARRICVYLIREFLPRVQHKNIALTFGDFDESWVTYSVDMTEDLLDTDKQFKRKYDLAHSEINKLR